MQILVSCVHSTHSTHAHFCFCVSMSSACQRHLVQDVLVWRPQREWDTNILANTHTSLTTQQLKLEEEGWIKLVTHMWGLKILLLSKSTLLDWFSTSWITDISPLCLPGSLQTSRTWPLAHIRPLSPSTARSKLTSTRSRNFLRMSSAHPSECFPIPVVTAYHMHRPRHTRFSISYFFM